MVTVSIKDEYVEVLSALGDLQAATDLAIQRYTIEQITGKVVNFGKEMLSIKLNMAWIMSLLTSEFLKMKFLS